MQMTLRPLLMEPHLVGDGQWGWEVVHRDKKVSMEIWGVGGGLILRLVSSVCICKVFIINQYYGSLQVWDSNISIWSILWCESHLFFTGSNFEHRGAFGP